MGHYRRVNKTCRAPLLLSKKARRLALVSCVLQAVAGPAFGAAFVIESNTVDLPFVVSFRDLGVGSQDANYTTFFGWTGNNTGGSGDDALDDFGFDGSATPGPPLNLQNDERIYNPPVIVGAGGLDGSLNQIEDIDILATSNNILAGDVANIPVEGRLRLEIATNGVVGSDGFTTIIIQGIGSVTGSGTNAFPVMGTINGISADYVFGVNAVSPTARIQWWAKYQLPGNQASYTLDILLPAIPGANPVSIRELVVDTQFSATGYAQDLAVVPEPSSWIAFVGGAGLLGLVRRRTAR